MNFILESVETSVSVSLAAVQVLELRTKIRKVRQMIMPLLILLTINSLHCLINGEQSLVVVMK